MRKIIRLSLLFLIIPCICLFPSDVSGTSLDTGSDLYHFYDSKGKIQMADIYFNSSIINNNGTFYVMQTVELVNINHTFINLKADYFHFEIQKIFGLWENSEGLMSGTIVSPVRTVHEHDLQNGSFTWNQTVTPPSSWTGGAFRLSPYFVNLYFLVNGEKINVDFSIYFSFDESGLITANVEDDIFLKELEINSLLLLKTDLLFILIFIFLVLGTLLIISFVDIYHTFKPFSKELRAYYKSKIYNEFLELKIKSFTIFISKLSWLLAVIYAIVRLIITIYLLQWSPSIADLIILIMIFLFLIVPPQILRLYQLRRYKCYSSNEGSFEYTQWDATFNTNSRQREFLVDLLNIKDIIVIFFGPIISTLSNSITIFI